MSEKIAKLSYLSPTIAKDFTNSLQSTGFVILKDSPIDQVLLEEVYALWEVFFKSEERFLYPFDTTTSDGYASEALSETAKGHHVKDLKAFYHQYLIVNKHRNSLTCHHIVKMGNRLNLLHHKVYFYYFPIQNIHY